MDEPKTRTRPSTLFSQEAPSVAAQKHTRWKLERDLAQEVRVPGHLESWCHFPRETQDSARFLPREAENELSNIGKTEDPGMRFWLQ